MSGPIREPEAQPRWSARAAGISRSRTMMPASERYLGPVLVLSRCDSRVTVDQRHNGHVSGEFRLSPRSAAPWIWGLLWR